LVIEPPNQLVRPRRGLGSASPLVSFIVLGLPAGAIGVAWPFMRSTFSAPLAGLGVLLFAVTVGYIAGSSVTGPIAMRWGTARLWITGTVLEALSLLGISITGEWWLVPVLGVVGGAGSGLIDASVNTEVSLERGVRYMGWLHASWAVGAAIGPLVVLIAETATGSWRPAFAAVGIAFLAAGALTWMGRRAKTVEPTVPRGESGQGVAPGYRLAIVILGTLLFLAAGVESTAGDWSYSELTIGRGVSSTLAGFSVSLFWFGLAAGRVGLGLVGNRLSVSRLLDLSVGITLLGAALFWIAPAVGLAAVALAVLGAAISLVYPLLLSLTPSRVGSAMTGHSVGIGLAAGTVGGGGIPALVGIILQSVGLWSLGPLLTLIAAGLVVLHGFSRRGSMD
jgi:fucose permease